MDYRDRQGRDRHFPGDDRDRHFPGGGGRQEGGGDRDEHFPDETTGTDTFRGDTDRQWMDYRDGQGQTLSDRQLMFSI